MVFTKYLIMYRGHFTMTSKARSVMTNDEKCLTIHQNASALLNGRESHLLIALLLLSEGAIREKATLVGHEMRASSKHNVGELEKPALAQCSL